MDQIGNGDSLDGNGNAQTNLVANIKESVARTALAWTATGRPFNELARTRKLQLTTALMSYLAFVDARGVTNCGSVNDRYYLSLPAAERPDAGFTVQLGVPTGTVDPKNLETQAVGRGAGHGGRRHLPELRHRAEQHHPRAQAAGELLP